MVFFFGIGLHSWCIFWDYIEFLVCFLGLDRICGVFFGVRSHLWCIYFGLDRIYGVFFGWVDRELLAVVAPNVLSHSITVTDTLLRSVTYQHNGHDGDGDDSDEDDDVHVCGNDDDDLLLKKFGNKICWQRHRAESNKIRL